MSHCYVHIYQIDVLVGLLAEVEAKAIQPEYAQLLQDCRNVYCSIRQQVRAGLTEMVLVGALYVAHMSVN
jgi:hypothetical protein